MTFPVSDQGTYLLIMEISAPVSLVIGKLGKIDFTPGWYGYVGSAFGAGGLQGRLAHHLRTEKKLHWHIDYLRQAATIQEIWYVASSTVYEHQWAQLLATTPQIRVPVQRFGASDCHCSAHLFYSTTPIDFADFRQRTAIPVERWKIAGS